MSEISIDLNGSQQRVDTPMPQLQQHSPLTYKQPKHHSFPGGDLLSVRPDSSSISSLTEPELSPNCRRALIGKFKSLPKLMPIKRNSPMGSFGSNSKAKKGVRWKPMIDSPGTKSLNSPVLEMERLYSSTSSDKCKYLIHNRGNSSDTTDVKFTDCEFPVLKTRLCEPLYCDLCQQRISASSNPETVGYEINLKHSVSAPLITNEHTDNSRGHGSSHSWQNKFLDKVRFRTRRGSSPCSELQCKPGVTECTSLSSQSVPNIAFWASMLPTDSQELEEIDSEIAPLASTSKESFGGNILPLFNLASAELPSIKTLVVPNPELEMDALSPPNSRKNSDILNESSVDTSSWKSADWTTLLGGDIRSS